MGRAKSTNFGKSESLAPVEKEEEWLAGFCLTVLQRPWQPIVGGVYHLVFVTPAKKTAKRRGFVFGGVNRKFW